MAPLLQRFIQLGLEGEIEAHLAEEREEGSENRRNGRGKKVVQSEYGPLEVEPPNTEELR